MLVSSGAPAVVGRIYACAVVLCKRVPQVVLAAKAADFSSWPGEWARVANGADLAIADNLARVLLDAQDDAAAQPPKVVDFMRYSHMPEYHNDGRGGNW